MNADGPRSYRAPGRVNLIGEHTDYNDGFVLPSAIARATHVTAAPREDLQLGVSSREFPERHVFDLAALEPGPMGRWSDLVRGVAIELVRDGAVLRGADLVIRSDVPVGAGLSSSASVAVACGFALLDRTGLPIDRVALALAAQRAENAHVGANVGVMDPFASANARAGEALLLDTRSLVATGVPLPADAVFVACDTGVKHEHATGGYNDRRAECDAGVAVLRALDPSVRALRDVTLARLEAARGAISDVVFRRCRHVVTENARTTAAADRLAAGDVAAFGRAMNESHASMRDDFEISAPEIEAMVATARDFGGDCYGARLTGGGFGGCTVNLVAAASVEAFVRHVRRGYRMATGIEPAIYVGVGAAGAGPEDG